MSTLAIELRADQSADEAANLSAELSGDISEAGRVVGSRVALWVRRLGTEKEAARILDAEPRTVRAWRGGNPPNALGMAKLAAIFGGDFLTDVFAPYLTDADRDAASLIARLRVGLDLLGEQLNETDTHRSLDRGASSIAAGPLPAPGTAGQAAGGGRPEPRTAGGSRVGSASSPASRTARTALNLLFAGVVALQTMAAFDSATDLRRIPRPMRARATATRTIRFDMNGGAA